jgi:hypothetical protein
MPPSMKMLVMISAIVVADGAALRKKIRVFWRWYLPFEFLIGHGDIETKKKW